MNSPFTCALIATSFLTAGWVSDAVAQDFDRVVSFGDSLSDTGNLSARTFTATGGLQSVPYSPPYYATLGDPFSPPSLDNPPRVRFSNGPVWNERLATNLGLPLTSFAFGGSRIGTPSTPTFDLGAAVGQAPNVVVADNLTKQVSDYLGAGVADGSTVYTFLSGANDFAFDLNTLTTDPDAFLQSAIGGLSGSIAQVATREAQAGNGRDVLLVGNLPDLSRVPLTEQTIETLIANDPTAAAIGKPALLAGVSSGVDAFNAALVEALLGPNGVSEQTGADIRIVDVHALFDEASSPDNPLGLTNQTDPFFTDNGTGLAGQQTDPDADPATDLPDYLFIDVQHPTAGVHTFLGDSATVLVPEPSMLPLVAFAGLLATRRRWSS